MNYQNLSKGLPGSKPLGFQIFNSQEMLKKVLGSQDKTLHLDKPVSWLPTHWEIFSS